MIVQNVVPHTITWGDMQGLLWGLKYWCAYRTCRFQFSVEELGPRVGQGMTF